MHIRSNPTRVRGRETLCSLFAYPSCQYVKHNLYAVYVSERLGPGGMQEERA